jgi:hypothetical protein
MDKQTRGRQARKGAVNKRTQFKDELQGHTALDEARQSER